MTQFNSITGYCSTVGVSVAGKLEKSMMAEGGNTDDILKLNVGTEDTSNEQAINKSEGGCEVVDADHEDVELKALTVSHVKLVAEKNALLLVLKSSRSMVQVMLIFYR